MKMPVRWHYGSITHSWLQLPPDTTGVPSHFCIAKEGLSPQASREMQEEALAVTVLRGIPAPRGSHGFSSHMDNGKQCVCICGNVQ